MGDETEGHGVSHTGTAKVMEFRGLTYPHIQGKSNYILIFFYCGECIFGKHRLFERFSCENVA